MRSELSKRLGWPKIKGRDGIMSDYDQTPSGPGAPVPGKGMAIASMVLGICSLVIPYAGTVTAIVGLVLGVISKKKLAEVNAPAGMATAGIVMSIISLAWSVLLIIICSSCLAAGGLAGGFADFY